MTTFQIVCTVVSLGQPIVCCVIELWLCDDDVMHVSMLVVVV